MLLYQHSGRRSRSSSPQTSLRHRCRVIGTVTPCLSTIRRLQSGRGRSGVRRVELVTACASLAWPRDGTSSLARHQPSVRLSLPAVPPPSPSPLVVVCYCVVMRLDSGVYCRRLFFSLNETPLITTSPSTGEERVMGANLLRQQQPTVSLISRFPELGPCLARSQPLKHVTDVALSLSCMETCKQGLTCNTTFTNNDCRRLPRVTHQGFQKKLNGKRLCACAMRRSDC